MNLSQLITNVADDTDLSQAASKRAIESVIKHITQAISKGDTAMLMGFGTFKVVKRAARPGRNPKTGAPAEVPAHKAIKFTPSPTLKCRIN